jgi:parvulin-like peptidyl-prolyl isomerase
MAFRRPVLDRKHRPRWQDELRTQQLVVAGFALAIAVAVGIFAAAAWSSFYESRLRQVAMVDDTPVERAEMLRRTDLIAAELQGRAADLSGLLGGARDSVISQQLQTLDETFNRVDSVASDSLLTGLLLDHRAAEVGVTVTDEELDAEIARRRTHSERRQLSLIVIVPEKEEGETEATDEAWAAAEDEAADILAEVEGGADFATLAAERSDDSTRNQNGLLGWVEGTDALFGDYYAAADGGQADEIVGPERNEVGVFLLRVEDVEPAGRIEQVDEALRAVGASDEEFRTYIRHELLRNEFRTYFADVVVSRYQPQRKVAQVFITPDQAQPIPKVRIRHLLAQPLPGAEDQSVATDEQWEAAEERAQELLDRATDADADWFELAQESDDGGSRTRGGYLGWFDPAGMAQAFVPEFAQAAVGLRVGETSDLVRTDFGYHVIQVTDSRTSALGLAEEVVQLAREDPDAFGDLALQHSEDVTTAREAGEFGWVAHYQFDRQRDEAVFALDEIGEISDPIVTGAGIYIYKLLDTSDARFVPERDRSQIASSGFSRWLDELTEQADMWVDTEFAPATDTTTTTPAG